MFFLIHTIRSKTVDGEVKQLWTEKKMSTITKKKAIFTAKNIKKQFQEYNDIFRTYLDYSLFFLLFLRNLTSSNGVRCKMEKNIKT